MCLVDGWVRQVSNKSNYYDIDISVIYIKMKRTMRLSDVHVISTNVLL